MHPSGTSPIASLASGSAKPEAWAEIPQSQASETVSTAAQIQRAASRLPEAMNGQSIAYVAGG